MKSAWFASLLAAITWLPATAWAQTPAPNCDGHPLLIPGKHALYQRIITRPGATMAPNPTATGEHPIAGFDVFYVYCRRNDWLQVGRDTQGHTEGWIPLAKSIDWKHAMVLAFTNPANRSPVLFLRTEQDEKNLLLSDDLAAASRNLLADAQAGHPGPLIAKEPSNWADILHNFYLLPILSAHDVERESEPTRMRLLEVISAPDTPPPQTPDQTALRNFKAGLVFLVDTTISMQPYIDATRDMIRSVVTQIETTQLRDKFRFGLVAYRDSLQDTPALEYPSRMYAKPDFSQPADAIMPRIADVQEARASSQSFDEDPIGGLKTTLDEIDWDSLAGRYIVLITDSGARPGNYPHSVTGLNISDIKAEAEAKHVSISVVHLLTPAGQAAHDHEKARSQYQQLTFFPNAQGSLYFPVPGGAPDAFRQTVSGLVNALLQDVAARTGVPAVQLRTPGALEPAQRARLQVVAEAMRLAYLGRTQETQAPDVVRSFTTDRDLQHPELQSVDVCVLLTRNQLSDLAKALEDILRAGVSGRMQPQTFFAQLRNVFAQTATDPQQIAHASSLGALISEYIDDLPYQSQIMSITEQDWLTMGAIKQDEILNDIRGKLSFYREYERHPEFWKDVTHSHNEGDKVSPIPLDRLP